MKRPPSSESWAEARTLVEDLRAFNAKLRQEGITAEPLEPLDDAAIEIFAWSIEAIKQEDEALKEGADDAASSLAADTRPSA